MGTELVKSHRHEVEPFEPTNLEQAFHLAEDLAQSNLLPTHLRGKPQDVFATLLLGRDLGLTPMQAILGIFVVEGKPSVSAQTAVALVKRSPLCKWFRQVESTDKRATYETWREGDPEPQRMTYTIEDAQRAGLAGKSVWKAHPSAMLRARCSMALARDAYSDVVANIYDDDEIDEIRERVSSSAITAPPPPKPSAPPAPKPPGPGPAVDAAARRAAPTQSLRPAAQGPAADAGPDPRPTQDAQPAAGAGAGSSSGPGGGPAPTPYTGPGSEFFDEETRAKPVHVPEDAGVNPGPAPAPAERRGKVDGVSQDGAVAGEIDRTEPSEQVPPDPVDPTVDAAGVVIVDQIVANLSVAMSIADYREQVKAAGALRRADEKQWLAPAMVTTLMRLLASGPEDELDAVLAALGKFRSGDWISRDRLAKAQSIYQERKVQF